VHKFYDNPAERTAPAEARVPACLQIGGVAIAPATVLAPMAGVTDTVFRRFIREMGGCGLIMTEFTSAEGVLRGKDLKAKRYLHFYEDEHPISAQLFGRNPEALGEAARMIEGLGFDLVDLNLGCPAKKVVKCNGGSGLRPRRWRACGSRAPHARRCPGSRGCCCCACVPRGRG